MLHTNLIIVYGRQKDVHNHVQEPIEMAPEIERLTLVDQYLALILAILTEAGLMDVCDLSHDLSNKGLNYPKGPDLHGGRGLWVQI
jgi:hypothetical protein